MGKFLRCLMVAGVLALGSVLAEVAGEKVTSNSEIASAMNEILTLSAGLECQEPQAWSIGGNIGMAAQFLVEELKRRGWDVLQSGQLAQSYAVVVDPNPDDPNAVVIAGLISSNAAVSEVFLSQCTVVESNTGFSPILDQRYG